MTHNIEIPKKVQKTALKALEWRLKFGRGGTSVGIETAEILAAGRPISIEKVMHIYRYFPRHEVDKNAPNFFNDEKPSNGRIAWDLWGGDAGRDWSRKNHKYYKGLDSKTAASREKAQKLKTEQYKRGDPRAFRMDLPGDKHKTTKSKYSGDKGTLEEIAEKYNAPISALKKIYNKGLAAWASGGHRPGASQHAWARARVMSVLKGGAARKVDHKEWAEIERFRNGR